MTPPPARSTGPPRAALTSAPPAPGRGRGTESVPDHLRRAITDTVAGGKVAVLRNDSLDALWAHYGREDALVRAFLHDLATALRCPLVVASESRRGDAVALSAVPPAGWSAEKVAGWLGGHRDDLAALCLPAPTHAAAWARPFVVTEGWPRVKAPRM